MLAYGLTVIWVDLLSLARFPSNGSTAPASSAEYKLRLYCGDVGSIFAFDPVREAVFLVAGDKSGQWQTWYRTAIPLADARFTEHLAALKSEEQS
jgi:hypothetical protein